MGACHQEERHCEDWDPQGESEGEGVSDLDQIEKTDSNFLHWNQYPNHKKMSHYHQKAPEKEGGNGLDRAFHPQKERGNGGSCEGGCRQASWMPQLGRLEKSVCVTVCSPLSGSESLRRSRLRRVRVAGEERKGVCEWW